MHPAHPPAQPFQTGTGGGQQFGSHTVPKAEGLHNLDKQFDMARRQLHGVLIGMEDVIDTALACAFTSGHILLQGAPGLAKTLLAKSIAQVLGLGFNRVQCTADLMPSDFTGTIIRPEGSNEFVLSKGPIFAHVLLVDEINRSTPKSQSALLEAMEERQVSIAGNTHPLPNPFWLVATQNEIGSAGTFSMPFAQLDRFMAKIDLQVPDIDQLVKIASATTMGLNTNIIPIFDQAKASTQLQAINHSIRSTVTIDEELNKVAAQIVLSLNPSSNFAMEEVVENVECGPIVRGLQSLIILSKTFAALRGSTSVDMDDIIKAALPTLRHRIQLSYGASQNGSVSPDELIESAIEQVQ